MERLRGVSGQDTDQRIPNKDSPEGRVVLEEKKTISLRKHSPQGAGWYLWVSRGSVLHIQGQCLGVATLSDQVSCIQGHVLV